MTMLLFARPTRTVIRTIMRDYFITYFYGPIPINVSEVEYRVVYGILEAEFLVL